MKPYLPHNILLALTILVTGLCVGYNLLIRESYATTLRYSYPEIEPVSTAEKTADTEEPYIYYQEEELAAPQPQEPSGITSVRFPLDINAASVEELKFIPQVGDVMAQRITQYREHLGIYTDLEQLREIKGVGDKTYEHLYAYLYIPGIPEETVPDQEAFDTEVAPDVSEASEASSEEPDEDEEVWYTFG